MTAIHKTLVIVGGGPAGYAGAIRASQLGLDVALIEEDRLGGSCLNRGCIPTKALLESAHLFAKAKTTEFGLTGEFGIDLNSIFERKDKLVERLQKGIRSLIDANKIAFFNAKAGFVGPNELQLSDGTRIIADRIILAVGAEPVMPPIEGIENSLSSNEVLEHRFGDVKSVAIVGAGVIGAEFATFFSSMGCEVTLLDNMPRILSVLPSDVSKYVGLNLRRSGVKLCTGVSVKAFRKADNGMEVLYLEKDKEKSIVADLVLTCVGRRALKVPGMEQFGIEYSRGIVVDANNRTQNPAVYAVGDCAAGSIQLAHYATASALKTVQYISEELKGIATSQPTVKKEIIPSCVYTFPPVAKVGIGEDEAIAQGRKIRIGKFNLGGNGKSLIASEERGYVKVLFDAESEILLGVEMVASEAPEMIGGLGTLVSMGAKRSDILASVYPHPSVCEGFFEAVEDSLKEAIHVIYK